MNPIAVRKSISIKLGLSENVPRYLKGDPKLLRQILLNLISNSIKFTPKGGIVIAVSLLDKIPLGADKKDIIYLEFYVEDTGIGIPEAKLESIFDSFTQADDSISKKYGGTGLGLTITKKFILAMGGNIYAVNREGQGSKFVFSLPFQKGNPNNIKNSLFEMQRPAAVVTLPQLKLILADNVKNKQVRILLVEDNETNKKVTNHFLSKRGYVIANASNGKDAIDALSKNNFDIILMDIEMPVMDGFESTLNIRNGKAGDKNRNIPIIGMTAHVGKYYRDKCTEVGMNSYASKPIRFQNLENIVKTTLNTFKAKASYSDILDVDAALSLYDGDTNLLNNLLSLFKSSKPAEIARFKNILFHISEPSVEEYKNAVLIIHSLKGDASAIGALKLKKVSQELELLIQKREIELARKLFVNFEADFNRLICLIKDN